jgi:hypothetical protein
MTHTLRRTWPDNPDEPVRRCLRPQVGHIMLFRNSCGLEVKATVIGGRKRPEKSRHDGLVAPAAGRRSSCHSRDASTAGSMRSTIIA